MSQNERRSSLYSASTCFDVKQFAGDDIAERLVCSSVEGKTDFLGGCSLVLLKNFYMNGGIPEQNMMKL